jgi:hypothetical protein
MPTHSIQLKPFTLARILGALAFVLILASIAGQLAVYVFGQRTTGIIRIFDVDSEHNIPTLFSALLLFCAALLLGVVTLLKRMEHDQDVLAWAILACGFLFLVFDETMSLHERLAKPLRRLLGEDLPGIFYFAWVIPGIAIVIILGFIFRRFLTRLPSKTRAMFMIFAALYVSGVIGMELIGGSYSKAYGQDNLPFNLLATVEESLEMIGIIGFIYALLHYLGDTYSTVRLRFDARENDG